MEPRVASGQSTPFLEVSQNAKEKEREGGKDRCSFPQRSNTPISGIVKPKVGSVTHKRWRYLTIR
jgi:hypothetical protein